MTLVTFELAKTEFIQQLNNDDFQFETTLAFIDQHFDFTASAFQNGPVANTIEQNQGSCKVLALSELLNLDKEQTLRCFGQHYRDVLATPEVDNHHNLRRLLKDGVTDIQFDQFPLVQK